MQAYRIVKFDSHKPSIYENKFGNNSEVCPKPLKNNKLSRYL